MAKSTVEIELLLELQNANKTLKQFTAQTEKQLKSIDTNTFVSAFVDGFGLIKDAAGTAFNIVKDFAGEAIAQAAEAEESQNKLANALKLSGQFSEEQVKSFNDLASSLQETTTFSDDAVLSAAALAKQYNLTNKEAIEVVKVSADLAAITGEDLNSSVKSVAQSFSGFVDRDLAKTIPGLKNLSKEALISGEAIGLIRERVGGSAQALGDTFNGSVIKAKNAFSDLLETLGGFITNNPVIIESINIIKDVIIGLNKEVGQNSDVISGVFVEGFKSFVAIVPSILSAFKFIDGVVSTTILGFTTLGRSIGAIAAAFVELARGNFSAIKDINKAVTEDNKKTFENNKKRLEVFYDPLIKSAQEASDRIQKIQKTSNDKQVKTNQEKNDKQIKDDRKANATKIDDLEKAAKEAQERIQNIAKDPIAFKLEETLKVELKDFSDSISKQRKEMVAAGLGLVAQVTKGAEGARKLVSSAIGAAADAIIPGIGGVVSEIVDVLGQGPEKTKQMVTEFARATPQIIENLAESLPVLIETLASELPPALAKTMPLAAVKFSTELIKNIPNIVTGFAKALVNAAGEFVRALIDSIKEGIGTAGGLLKSVTGGKGVSIGGAAGGGALLGPVGAIIGGVFGKRLGFADGGRIPDLPKFSGDRFPARLSAGEQVFSKDLSNRLETFLQAENSGRPLVVNLVVGEQQLAQSILNLNRRGFRTA